MSRNKFWICYLYATTDAPATLDETLDFAREKLDIIAPAVELLYKDAAEKMLKESTSGFVVGPSVVGNVEEGQDLHYDSV